MSYDGTEFKALDEEAFKDQFDDDQPLDVWLEQRIRSNTLYLASGYDSVSIPYLTSASDFTASSTDRYWCTRNKARHELWAVEVTRGMTGFDISGLIACGTDGSGGTGVDIEARIVDWTGPTPNDHRILGTETITYADTSGAFEGGELTVTFNGGVWTGPPRVLFLEIWLQGDDAGAAGKTYEMTWIRPDTLESSTALVADNFIRGYLRDDTRGGDFDVWVVDSANSKLKVYPEAFSFNGKLDFDVRYMYWLQIRSLSIRPTYDAVVRADLPSPAELGAQLPVASITAMPQVQGAAGTSTQVRHLAFGPAGQQPAVEGTLPEHWLWSESPVNEVIMQGIAQEGFASLEAIIVWSPRLPDGFDGRIDAVTTVTLRGLSTADTSWAAADDMGTGSLTTTHDGRAQTDSIVRQMLNYRYLEEVPTSLADEIPREVTFSGDAPELFVARVPITLDASFSAADWRRPMEIDIDIAITYANPYITGGQTAYVLAYTLMGRGA